MRFVVVDLLGEQQGIRAEDHEFAPGEVAFDDLRHLSMQQRFAASNRDDWCAAFIDRRHAVVVRQTLIENLSRVIDLAATSTGKVTAEQRLQHQDERVALASAEMLANKIGADAGSLMKRNSHGFARYCSDVTVTLRVDIDLSSAGSRNSISSRTPSICST